MKARVLLVVQTALVFEPQLQLLAVTIQFEVSFSLWISEEFGPLLLEFLAGDSKQELSDCLFFRVIALALLFPLSRRSF